MDTLVYVPGPAEAETGKDLFIMGQQKVYLSSTLYQHELLFELQAMGCTADIVLAGAWAHTVESEHLSDVKEDGEPIASGSHVRRAALVPVIAAALSKGTTFKAWLDANVPKISRRVVAQSAKSAAQAALTAAVGAGTTAADVDAAFVVVVIGSVAPLSREVTDLLPSNVLFLHAPPPTASTPAAAEIEHGGRLRGFYPVRVAHAGTAVQLSEVPVPVVPVARPPKCVASSVGDG